MHLTVQVPGAITLGAEPARGAAGCSLGGGRGRGGARGPGTAGQTEVSLRVGSRMREVSEEADVARVGYSGPLTFHLLRTRLLPWATRGSSPSSRYR